MAAKASLLMKIFNWFTLSSVTVTFSSGVPFCWTFCRKARYVCTTVQAGKQLQPPKSVWQRLKIGQQLIQQRFRYLVSAVLSNTRSQYHIYLSSLENTKQRLGLVTSDQKSSSNLSDKRRTTDKVVVQPRIISDKTTICLPLLIRCLLKHRWMLFELWTSQGE